MRKKYIFEFVIVLFLLGYVFVFNMKNVPFVGDESMWISRSNYFELYFTGNFRTIAHDKSPSIAMSMPTIPEYVIGLSRWIGGYRPSDLNNMYSYSETFEQNKVDGNVPSARLLWWSRLLPSIMGAISILVVFYLITAARNRMAGYIWLLVALVNNFLTSSLQIAMSESPLILGLTLATFAGYESMKSIKEDSSSNSKSLIWISLFGVFTGLAGQSKNNGLAIFLAGIVILVLLTIKIKQSLLTRLRFFGLGLIGLGLATFLFFIGPNPLLWKHPIKTSVELIPYRIGLMQRQAQLAPEETIKGWKGWIQTVPGQIFKNLTPFDFMGSEYIKFVLACLGFGVMALQTWRFWKAGHLDAGSFAILTTGIIATIPVLFTPLNWDRYFLIPVFFVSILIAIGIEFLITRFVSPVIFQRHF